MKKVIFAALFLVFCSGLATPAQSGSVDLSDFGVRIEPDRRLIVVLASLEAVGLDTPLTEKGQEFRRQLRADLAGFTAPATGGDITLHQRMKFFVDQYAKRLFARQRAQMVEEKRSTDELKKYDDDTRFFFEQLEKSRAGTQSDADRQMFAERSRSFIGTLVSPFISMAYTLGPVPDLNEPSRTTDLPGDLLEVLDYSPYVRQFYRAVIRVKDGETERSTTVGARIDEYYKEYQAVGDALRPSTSFMVRDILDYLHTKPQLTFAEQVKTEVKTGKKTTISKTEIRERTRRFYIVPDLLAQVGTINFRNIGDDYFAIVPPGTDVSESEVRRAYLQFVIDPIILKHAKDVLSFKEPIRGLLDERRKTNPDVSTDVFLAVSRSLVVAAEARQAYFRKFQDATFEARRAVASGRKPLSETTDASGRKVVRLTEELYLIDGRFAMPEAEDEMNLKLYDAYERGAVLSFYFAQALRGLEDSEFDISSSLRDILLSFEPAKETTRLADNAESRKRALDRREERRRMAANIIENPIPKRLGEIELLIQSQRYSQAETELLKMLETYPTEPRVFYALGRVRSLLAASITVADTRNEHLAKAKEYLTRVVDDKAPQKADPALVSLAYVALARLYEYYDQNAYAIRIYEKVISLGNMKGGGYDEAVAARDRLLKLQQ